MFRPVAYAALLSSVALPLRAEPVSLTDVFDILSNIQAADGIAYNAHLMTDQEMLVLEDVQVDMHGIQAIIGDIPIFSQENDGIRAEIPSGIRMRALDLSGEPFGRGVLHHEDLDLQLFANIHDDNESDFDADLTLAAPQVVFAGEAGGSPDEMSEVEHRFETRQTLTGLIADLNITPDGMQGEVQLADIETNTIRSGLFNERTAYTGEDVSLDFFLPGSLILQGNYNDVFHDLLHAGLEISGSTGPSVLVTTSDLLGQRTEYAGMEHSLTFFNGVLGLALETEVIETTIIPGQGGDAYHMAFDPVALDIEVPLFAGPVGDVARFHLEMPEVSLSQTIHELIDPDDLLPRDPISMTIDARAPISHETSIDEVIAQLASAGISDPVISDYFSDLTISGSEIHQFTLSGFGVALDVDGEVSLEDGLNLNGEALVTLSGLGAFTDALAGSDVVDEVELRMMLAMFEVYFDEIEDDVYQAEVTFSEDEILINGRGI